MLCVNTSCRIIYKKEKVITFSAPVHVVQRDMHASGFDFDRNISGSNFNCASTIQHVFGEEQAACSDSWVRLGRLQCTPQYRQKTVGYVSNQVQFFFHWLSFLVEVTILSPNTYFNFTPLLAGTAVGTLEFRCTVEPIRRYTPQVVCVNRVLSKGKS